VLSRFFGAAKTNPKRYSWWEAEMPEYPIDTNFKYHAPDDEQQAFYVGFRNTAKALASDILEHIPDCRERSLALTKLEECVMWGNAGVARNGLAK
jgi:hypothetical protein